VANPFAQPPTAPEVPRQKEPPPRSRGFVIADRGRGQAAQLHAQALADIRDGALGRAWQLACMAAAAAPDDPRYQETIANWAAVVAEHQTPADARLYAQAIRKESLGDAQGAITLLRQAIAENANNAAAHNRLGVLLAASHGDLREAVAALERAVALAPDDATFRNNLGKVAAAAERKGLASLFKLIGRR
jgi:Flp pilus assembly protein TadD